MDSITKKEGPSNMERLTDEYIFDLDKEYETYVENKEKGCSESYCMEQDLKRQIKVYKILEKRIGVTMSDLFTKILGKYIYYLDDDCCETCRAMGIQLVTTNESIFSFTSVIPDYYDYIITTDSCWTFRLSDYGKSWFLDEKEAESAFEVYEEQTLESLIQ